MILESIIVCVVIVYFMSWLTGVIEGLLFGRFVREAFPNVAAEYFPGLLKTSIFQQRETRSWLKNRKYADLGDSKLTKRADLHRKISLIAFWVMVGSFLALILLSIAYRNLPPKDLSHPPVEQLSTNP